MTGNDDPEFAHVDPKMSSFELISYAMKMAEEKGKKPGRRHRDGPDQRGHRGRQADRRRIRLSFVVMLAVAGNETTRNSITQRHEGVHGLPRPGELYKKERPETAADEIVRWATPVTCFQRTALDDTELSVCADQEGPAAGDVLPFGQLRRRRSLTTPLMFNILRDPNPHVGFGGTGAHYCIGANLAGMTINLIFNAVADQTPDLKPLGDPDRLRSGWLNGIKQLAGGLHRRRRAGRERAQCPVAH